MESMIANILLAISEARDEKREAEGLPLLFHLQKMDMLLPSSGCVPRRKRSLQPDAGTPVRNVDEKLRERVRHESAERVVRGISRQKIEAWILDMLGQRGRIEIRELLVLLREAENPDLLQILFIYLYGHDDLARYHQVRLTLR